MSCTYKKTPEGKLKIIESIQEEKILSKLEVDILLESIKGQKESLILSKENLENEILGLDVLIEHAQECQAKVAELGIE